MVEVRVAETERELADVFAVRRRVFVDEQGVDESIEYDDHDETAVHVVAYDGETAIGAARLRAIADDVGKVERVAVCKSRRKEGVGRQLMDTVERQARSRGLETLTLHSQTRAAPFYDRLGYDRYGETFEEAGIPHVTMRKSLA